MCVVLQVIISKSFSSLLQAQTRGWQHRREILMRQESHPYASISQMIVNSKEKMEML